MKHPLNSEKRETGEKGETSKRSEQRETGEKGESRASRPSRESRAHAQCGVRNGLPFSRPRSSFRVCLVYAS